jgi:hypothetical protein
MSRIVARLEGEGLVERRRSSEDGRGQVVALTDAGLAQLEATFPGHLASVRHHVFDALTGVDLDSFTDALSRIAPDEPLAHLSNVEIPSRQRAAGEPGAAQRPRSPGKLRSIIGIIAVHRPGQSPSRSSPGLPASTGTATRKSSHAARCDHSGPAARPAPRALSLRSMHPRKAPAATPGTASSGTESNQDGNSLQVPTSLTIWFRLACPASPGLPGRHGLTVPTNVSRHMCL